MIGLCHHGKMRGYCQWCTEDQHRRNCDIASAPTRLAAAVSETNEWWRDVGGDYYPATERIAAKHGVDVWALRDAWLAPVHARLQKEHQG